MTPRTPSFRIINQTLVAESSLELFLGDGCACEVVATRDPFRVSVRLDYNGARELAERMLAIADGRPVGPPSQIVNPPPTSPKGT